MSTTNNSQQQTGLSDTHESLIPLCNVKPSFRVNEYKKNALDQDFVNIHRGPTATSNWLIPNRVLMSAYPGDKDSRVATQKIKAVLDAGIRTFVCLQQPDELARFSEYKSIALDEFSKLNMEAQERHGPVQLLQFPIPDQSIAVIEEVELFVTDLVERYNRGENMLIHCWGGHGRTGTISAIFLIKKFNLTFNAAIARVGMVHTCRDQPKSRAPQTQSQFRQVNFFANQQRRLLGGTDSSSDDDEAYY